MDGMSVPRADLRTRPPKGSAACLWLALFLVLLGAEGGAAELRSTLSAGYSDVVDGHGSFGAGLRVQVAGPLFVQAEYLALRGERHTDHGPTLLAGFSSSNHNGLRPYIGVGGGPVKGYAGDDGILYFALGAAHPVGHSRRAFVQAEFRAGLLGESRYKQLTLGIGLCSGCR